MKLNKRTISTSLGVWMMKFLKVFIILLSFGLLSSVMLNE